ncbi:hypothetical protein V1508DRAFT_216297 [Lipomyces doorenjongii]|uniref:uncharacterized protein n=1 Tax=Lipomyces doorenjongii TaxID=383834 RepID=UPI0034CFEE39
MSVSLVWSNRVRRRRAVDIVSRGKFAISAVFAICCYVTLCDATRPSVAVRRLSRSSLADIISNQKQERRFRNQKEREWYECSESLTAQKYLGNTRQWSLLSPPVKLWHDVMVKRNS